MIKIRKIQVEPTDVYDVTVPETSAFVANSLVVHNCAEITLPTKPLQDLNDPDGLIALCTLSAINWGKIREPKDFEKPCTLAIRGLDALLSYQSYPVLAAQRHTDLYRPLGVGIINLAYWLAKNGVKYTDDAALAMVDEYAEAWSYYLIKASIDLAREKGACEGSSDTKYSQGLMPIDTRKAEVDELVPYQERMPWDSLRAAAKEHGIRNSTVMALMPSECQSKDNLLLMLDGSTKTLGKLLEDAGVNVNHYEENQMVGARIDIKPVDLPGGRAVQAYYNGIQPMYEVDIGGDTYKFTGNHLLLVCNETGEHFVRVDNLKSGDEIVSI